MHNEDLIEMAPVVIFFLLVLALILLVSGSKKVEGFTDIDVKIFNQLKKK